MRRAARRTCKKTRETKLGMHVSEMHKKTEKPSRFRACVGAYETGSFGVIARARSRTAEAQKICTPWRADLLCSCPSNASPACNHVSASDVRSSRTYVREYHASPCTRDTARRCLVCMRATRIKSERLFSETCRLTRDGPTACDRVLACQSQGTHMR